MRAGAVFHPAQWDVCGYREIQDPPERYRLIDLPALRELLGIRDPGVLQRAHAGWIEEALKAEDGGHEKIWSESVAVGSREFVTRFQTELGVKGYHREILQYDDYYRLSEPPARYGSDFDAEMASLGDENMVFMD